MEKAWFFWGLENGFKGRANAMAKTKPSAFTGLGSQVAAARRMLVGFVDQPTVNVPFVNAANQKNKKSKFFE